MCVLVKLWEVRGVCASEAVEVACSTYLFLLQFRVSCFNLLPLFIQLKLFSG